MRHSPDSPPSSPTKTNSPPSAERPGWTTPAPLSPPAVSCSATPPAPPRRTAPICSGTPPTFGSVSARRRHRTTYMSYRTVSQLHCDLETYNNGIANGSSITTRTAEGTIATPTALQSGHGLFAFLGQGYDGSSFQTGASMNFSATENWSSAARGSSMSFLTTASALRGRHVLRCQMTAAFYTPRRYAISPCSFQSPLSGFSIAIVDTCGALLLNPAGALAAGSITMPAHPKDGQICRIASSQAVSALTLAPASGQSLSGGMTAFSTGSFVEYLFVSSANTWFRVG